MGKSSDIANGLIGGGQQIGGAVGEGMQAVGNGIIAYNDFTGHDLTAGIEQAALSGYDCVKAWEDMESGNYFGQ